MPCSSGAGKRELKELGKAGYKRGQLQLTATPLSVLHKSQVKFWSLMLPHEDTTFVSVTIAVEFLKQENIKVKESHIFLILL